MYKLCLTTVIYSNTSYLFCQDLFLFFSRFYALFLFKRLSRLCVTVFLRTAYLYYHNSNNLSIPFFDIFCPIASALKRQPIYINRYFTLCQHFFANFFNYFFGVHMLYFSGKFLLYIVCYFALILMYSAQSFEYIIF